MLDGSDVVVSCLTENHPRLIAQAVRLLRSIRWYGGALASSRVVVCAVNDLHDDARRTLESLGAEIRIVTRFHPANPTANRLQQFAALDDTQEEVMLLLDCDTIVVQDPLPHLTRDAFQAKIAPIPSVTHEVFERLFAKFDLPLPPRTHVTPFTGTPTIPYYNAGVLAMPRGVARELAPAWRHYNAIIASNPQLADPCRRHMHQASLTLALAATGVPQRELSAALNYQLNAQEMTPPPGFAEMDPVIIHYHQLVDDDGLLLPVPYPPAQARIDVFNARMRSEGHAGHAAAQINRPIVVAGMHRSGTSIVTEVLQTMGAHPGSTEDLLMADMFNPTGYWENLKVRQLDVELLRRLDADWTEPLRVDLSRLTTDERAEYTRRARAAAAGVTLLKDPHMALLLPFWREVLPDAAYVIVWREPLAVAASVKTRDALPLPYGLALWEHYTRTVLRETRGLPRVLVSYDELVREPMRTARELHARLQSLGIEGLALPSPERLSQSVQPEFNRSAIGDDALLDPEQRELRELLRSGAIDEVPPTSPRTRALLTAFSDVWRERKQPVVVPQSDERDLLLEAVFASKIWKVGKALTRVLRKRGEPTAEDRWRGR